MKMTKVTTYVEMEDKADGVKVVFDADDTIGIRNFGVYATDPEIVRTFQELETIKISLIKYLLNKIS